MPSSTVVVAVTAGYLLLCLILGMWPGRKSTASADGYVAGDRTLGLLLMYFITGATVFSAFAFLGAPGWAYRRGAAVFYILGYGVLGFVPFYFLGPRAARLGRVHGFVTQAEMVSARFRLPALAGVMAVISALAFVPYLALQMKGAGYVIHAVTRKAVPVWAGAALVYGVVTVYVLRSGVLGVGWTNTFQGICMMVLAWALGLYLPYRLYGGVGDMFTRLAAERPELLFAPGLTAQGASWSWGEYSSAVLVSVAGLSVWPHLFMKAFTARDGRTIRLTVVLYPTFQLFLVPLFLIGFAGVLFSSAPGRADQILPHMLMHMDLPAVLVGLFCAGALAASMSSGDAMVHAGASVAVRDGLVAAVGLRLKPDRERAYIRYFVLVFIAAAYFMAVVYRGSLVVLLLTAYGGIVQFMPIILVTLYVDRIGGRAVLAALVAGSAVTALFVIWPGGRPWAIHAGIYGLGINLSILIGAALLPGRGGAVPLGEFYRGE